VHVSYIVEALTILASAPFVLKPLPLDLFLLIFFVVLPSGYLLFNGLWLGKSIYNRKPRWFFNSYLCLGARFSKFLAESPAACRGELHLLIYNFTMESIKPFSLLIKPASADCNLRCRYCFYLEKSRLYPQTKTHRMSDLVLEQVIKKYLSTEQQVYTFGWQGGEPTLMDIKFFKRITELQEKHARPGSQIANGLQTNATLIDDALAGHLARYRFLVGCSLDGPPELHNRYRRYASGRPSHAAVLKGIETLRRHRVELNILVLVSKANVHRARDVYRYLVEQGFFYHQYIPCVEFDKNANSLPFSISGEEWGQFLCELFDIWYPRDIHRISIRHFDAILNKLVDNSTTVCSLAKDCCQYFLIEYNGDIYPCDFFVEKDLRIGNIADTSWEVALSSSIYRRFGSRKSEVHSDCRSCNFFDLCLGDCLKHRKNNRMQTAAISHLCAGWEKFFAHSRQSFDSLAQKIRHNQIVQKFGHQSVIPNKKVPSVGRNQPCPCGSGKKFKKCCGR